MSARQPQPLTKLTLMGLLLVGAVQLAAAGQGCPFDDGSCQEYCSQQGCNMGYCGHFAWIQCICRKCGDEWSYYDKVRYNPEKAVNQTELDSLKLNATSTLILTDSSQQQAPADKPSAASQRPEGAPEAPKKATLTTLLIPDLSDSGKLDLNDIPDENSDKFLDYLAKNHEKLVQATKERQQSGDDASSTEASSTDEPLVTGDEETVEIEISTRNNQKAQQQTPAQQQPSTRTQEGDASPTRRLLQMAVASEDDAE